MDFNIYWTLIGGDIHFADYYAKYGTTEERDGWKMANLTGNRVIYVKTT